ncbi:HAMP domain-containing sensor histidine kinase [Actinomadura fibrosa]|uniref:histidine kinase n=1 Tax=Actinomadura fibrosa TaxID=111802 RepID=A0ABW2XSJ2_9ACTN|nr:HAMP domain-containing sensor histidine kinase [Actinomadura fibrosa]
MRAPRRGFRNRRWTLSLRARVALLAAGTVIAAILMTSIVSFTMFTGRLHNEIDQTLVAQAGTIADNVNGRPGDRHDADLFAALDMSVAIVRQGQVTSPPGTHAAVPVDMAAVGRVSAPGGPRYVLADGHSGGAHMRVITVRASDGTVIVLARSLAMVDRTVTWFGYLTIAVGLGAAVLAAGAGIAVAGAGLQPVRRLTRAVAGIARTQDLNTAPIRISGDDEISRLAGSFNAMLAALNRSRERQRRLVADAGHELRTPLTSLRTNIDLLIAARAHPERALPHGSMDALLADLKAQLRELTNLVGDLVELAKDEEQAAARTRVRLDRLVPFAVDRVRLRAPAATFRTDLEPWLVQGSEPDLVRAVTNLLDNAVKFSPPDGTVHIVLREGELIVADEGPGIPEENLPHVFERFYRAPEARALPGSGLGLAIVRHTAEQHGGTVSAGNRPGGGAVLRLRLPGASHV